MLHIDHCQLWIGVGGLLGASGVALGAVGSHAIKNNRDPALADVWNIGVNYQMYHALALCSLPLVANTTTRNMVGSVFLTGTMLFSGGLYLVAATEDHSWARLSPIGGMLLIAGWSGLAVSALMSVKRSHFKKVK